jgi:hypothetical protein
LDSKNLQDYLCDECSNGNSPITNEEKEFLLLFIDDDKIYNYKTHEDIFKNEKSDYLVNQIYKKSFIDNNLYNKIWDAFYKIQDSEHICSKCSETIRNTFMNHSYDFYKMYKKIELIEINDLANQISKKSKINKDSILNITRCEGFSQLWLIEESLKLLDVELYNKYVSADKSLQWFNWDEKGGGDYYSEIIEYIRIFIVSIVIPGIIWDFTKMGVIRFYQLIRKFLVNKKYTDSVNNELLKNEEEIQKYGKNFSKKEIKKIVKKEVKRKIKDITKNCKHKTKGK